MILKIHALAHALYRWRVPLIPRFLYGVNRILFAVVLPPSVKLGRGVTLGYSGLGIVIHARCVIGDRVLVGTGVTIGGRGKHHDVPVIGDDVEIGSGAKILGPIQIGCGAVIGANAVVLNDVPPHTVVVGIPGRVVRMANTHAD